MSQNILEDVIAMSHDLIELVQDDPRVLTTEMVTDENRGTMWLIHLRNGDTLWSGAGMFETATRCRRHYRVRPRSRGPICPPVDDKDPIPPEDIEVWIRRRHPEIDDWSFDRHVVLYGLVQAGKTELILSMIWISQYVYKIPCVLVLANMEASYNQVLGKNVPEFNCMMRDEFGERASPLFLKTTGYRGRSSFDIDIEQDHTWLRVAMGNPAQLRRLVNTTHNPFVLFSDEADVHVKGWNDNADMTSTGPLMKQLQGMAVGSVKITATPFALYNQDGALQKTIVMNKPNNYRGLSETEWVFSTDADSKSVRQGSAPKAVRLLNEMVTILRPRVESDSRKYMTILVNGPATIARQNALAQAITRRRPQWCAYVMNSDGGKSSIKQAMRTHMIPTGMVTISSLYDKFERDGGDEFKVNIIVACLTASRAISFRPTSKRRGTGGLHGMIFFPSATCHAAQLIQFMRVWGKFDENYPHVRVRTTQTVYDKLYSEITHNLKAFAEITSETGLSREQIEGVHVIDVGLHDRRAVDDTKIVDKVSMLKREFETEDEIREFLAGDFGNRVSVMTERLVPVRRADVEGGFHYGHYGVGGRVEQNRMTTHLKQISNDVPLDNGFQVCWHKTRYEDHHTMTRRYGNRRSAETNYMSRVVAGSGDDIDEFVNIVVWKPEYSKRQNAMEEWSLERFNDDRAYIFQTTKNTWRYYTTSEKRKCGMLSHA